LKFKTYLLVLATYLILDFVWLGLVSQASYESAIGHLMRESYPIWPWVTFYLLYSAVLTKLVVLPFASSGIKAVFLNGCLFGAAAYGAYNLTNYAILATWPLDITVKDWLWGTFVSGVITLPGALYLQKKPNH
jgi:uncharacterized membrane protein